MKQHQGMLLANVAALVELPAGERPKPLVWTEERVRAWRCDFEARLADARARANGGRVSPLDIWVSTPRPSPVMVWTPAQTQVFLAASARHRLRAMWRLIASRGLRRPDTDLHTAVTTIRSRRVPAPVRLLLDVQPRVHHPRGPTTPRCTHRYLWKDSRPATRP
jgi:hypothetical protein